MEETTKRNEGGGSGGGGEEEGLSNHVRSAEKLTGEQPTAVLSSYMSLTSLVQSNEKWNWQS